MIIESQIKAAIRKIPVLRGAPAGSKKSIELADDGERGSGRLVIVLRAYYEHVSGEWYAKYYSAGRRVMRKIGPYPDITIAAAREIYRQEYAPAISRGQEPPPGVRERRLAEKAAPTVAALFEAYVGHLKKKGSPSWKFAEQVLGHASKMIGAHRPAASITPGMITPCLKKIYDRGAPVMARETRAFVSAAFNHGLKSENDYTKGVTTTSWGLISNPAAAIPYDNNASKPGTRVLSEPEIVHFWRWCELKRDVAPLADVLRLLLCTGQRPGEIVSLGEAGAALPVKYLPDEAIMVWEKTKNGMPHAIPVPALAADILASVFPNRQGLYFPNRRQPKQPATRTSIGTAVDRYLAEFPDVPHFSPRDLRRTWKTVAGRAGLSKDIRDRMQNHARSDVSAIHYDRYEYLAEKKAAMDVWNAYLANLLAADEAEQRKAA